MLLGCPGVTIDLRDGTARTPDPRDGITKRCAVAPAEGPCPQWHEFLMQATGGDEDVIRFIQLWAGYQLTGLTSEHVLLFLFGPGGNGKSVLLNLLSRLLGDYAVTASMDAFTAARGERHPTDLAMLRGARMVTANETEEGRAWAESRIKAITGGDPITARFMRQDYFTYQPQFKVNIAGNHQPVLRNVDLAVRRRFLMLPFTQRPARPDPDLPERLWTEAPQILDWALRGCLEWQKEGLPRPEAISRATEDYFQDQDTDGAWLAEECDLGDASKFETSADLFYSWSAYTVAMGEKPGSQKAMAGRLQRLGLARDRRLVAGKVQRVWVGISLNGASQ